ncbi:MAG: membrane protein insertion efficiency factor YidD [Alphaproteobacteria bacterium]
MVSSFFKIFLGFVASLALKFYQIFRPFFVAHPGPTCRFVPTCSVYCVQMLERFGLWKGLFLTVKRLLACHPWGASGVDFQDESATVIPDVIHHPSSVKGELLQKKKRDLNV